MKHEKLRHELHKQAWQIAFNSNWEISVTEAKIKLCKEHKIPLTETRGDYVKDPHMLNWML